MRVLLRSMEGRDENGRSNAVCGMHIFSVGEEPPVEVRGYSCIDAEVRFHIVPRGMSEIDFVFSDEEDYDYLQVSDVCREFEERTEEGEECLINLVMTPDEGGESFVSAMCRVWTCGKPYDDGTSVTRFFVETEQIFEVSIPGGIERRTVDPMGSDYDVEWIG